MTTGPASLEAIKKGLVGYQYDTSFLFSEVNADVCHFVEDDDSPWRFTRIKLDPSILFHFKCEALPSCVTHLRCCQFAHSGECMQDSDMWKIVQGESQYLSERLRFREEVSQRSIRHGDLLHFPKVKNEFGKRYLSYFDHKLFNDLPQRSEAERAAVFNAIRAHPKAQKLYKAVKTPVVRDVYFKLKEIDSVLIGDTFSVSLTMENYASEQRKVNAALTASSVFYTGQIVDIIKEGDVEVNLQPKEVKTVRISVLPEDYHGMLAKSTFMKVMAVANVVETGQSFAGEDDFEVLRTKLEIKVSDHNIELNAENSVEKIMKTV
ncbi:hypothetical protein J6590_051698 [Homalodisca vitripennis]|nr:hypothetical protein J6590_051698 [Homalodisca vitripennis]